MLPESKPQGASGKLPLDTDALAQWKGDLDKAREVRKKVQAWWDANLDKYSPDQSKDPDDYGTEINTNRDFTLVERKKADLFYQKPDVSAVPSPLMVGQEQVVETHTTILNEKLGIDGVNAKDLVHRVLFDVLCPSGTGWTVMGYESVTVPTPMPDPTFQPPVDPLTGQPDPTAQAPTVMAPVPVYEECFWRWISPKQALVPHNFRSTIWDDAPWLGYDFELPLRTAKRLGWVPDDFTGSASSQELYFDHGLQQTAGDSVVKATMIYYKSALYRDDRVHPKHLTRLVLVDGVDEPAEHKDAPEQTLDPQGKLTPDSLIGNPIHPCTIRVLSDSAFVASDCTISRPLVNELNRFRGQMVQQRDSQIIVGFYNTDVMPTDALAKAVHAPMNGLVGIPGEAFVGDGPIKPIERGQFPRESYTSNDYLDSDLARTHAIDAEQSGADSGGDTTATEASIKQNNVNARLGLERGVVLDWYIRGVTKFSTLIQKFLPVEDAAQIVGQQAAGAWDQWRHQVPSALAFSAMPDSALRNDTSVDKKRMLDQYTFFANEPMVDRAAHLKHIFPRIGLPASLIVQPPEKGPEPPKLTLAITAADLDPMMPNYGNVFQVLTQMGVKNLAPPTVDPLTAHAMQAAKEAVADPNTTHGGKQPQAEGLSKHHADLSGGMQGTGGMAPMGPGGVQ